jgi:hypothetical protein
MMWPAQITCGDAAMAVSKLSMYLANPTQEHMDAALHCAEYLYFNQYDGICLGSNDDFDNAFNSQLEGYVDASFMDDEDSRKSTCGMVFKFGGGLIFWKSGRQPIVALSTTEAEHVAMTLAAKEAACLKRLIEEVPLHKHGLVILYEDNQPSIDLLKKPPGIDSRTKHIDLRYHFVCQQVSCKAISVLKIGTDFQAADRLTKALGKLKHQTFKELFGIVDCKDAINCNVESDDQ